MILRDYQQEDFLEIRRVYKSGVMYLVYVLPTGGGKTQIFCAIAQGAAAKGKRILILVHRNELLSQCREKLYDLGVPSGVIKAGHPMALVYHVQVGSIQTVTRRLDILPEPDLIICDEGHHATSASYRHVFNRWPNARRLLVTATPARLDGTGLESVAQSMVLGPDMQTLIDRGFLVPPVVYAPPGPDASSLHTVAGEFVAEEDAALMDKPTITGSAVEHYRRLCDREPGIAFCATLKHGAHVAEQFSASGYQAALIEGRNTDLERKQMLRDLAAGQLHLLTSVSLIGEGVDIPVCSVAFLLRHTQSLTVYLQACGRTLRTAPAKTRGLILDHVNAVRTFGLPQQSREWTLEGRKRSKRSADAEKPMALTVCSQCWATFEPAPICPQCGAPCLPQARKGPQEVAGELVQITAVNVEMQRKAAKQEVSAARTRQELEAIAARRGYKPGWIDYIMRSRNEHGYRGAIDPYATIKEWKGKSA